MLPPEDIGISPIVNTKKHEYWLCCEGLQISAKTFFPVVHATRKEEFTEQWVKISWCHRTVSRPFIEGLSILPHFRIGQTHHPVNGDRFKAKDHQASAGPLHFVIWHKSAQLITSIKDGCFNARSYLRCRWSDCYKIVEVMHGVRGATISRRYLDAISDSIKQSRRWMQPERQLQATSHVGQFRPKVPVLWVLPSQEAHLGILYWSYFFECFWNVT